jgi:hypothetical protein
MQTVGGGLRAAVLLIAISGCHSHGVPETAAADASIDSAVTVDATASTSIVVQATTTPIVLDGSWTEMDWDVRTTSEVFVSDSGEQARPFSEIRLLHDDATLYVGLYAADEDIESTDFFQVTIGTLDFRVYPSGRVSASADGLHAASDIDGTVDKPSDYDEEWVLEIAVPRTLVTLGSSPLPVHAARCDVTFDHVLRCGSADFTVVSDGAASAPN